MDLLNSKSQTYKPPLLIRGAHIETLFPHFFRRLSIAEPETIIIETPDDDFLEADLYRSSGKGMIILSHGLEGNSHRDYMIGMAKIFIANGYDVLAWNYRGCGTRMNIQPRMYHSGATDDLDTVVAFTESLGYTKLALIGFSLGGNLTLKYVGEKNQLIDSRIKAAMAISVPLDLDTGSTQLSRRENLLYTYRFLFKLREKVRQKHGQFPELVDLDGINKIKTLREFDDRYTGPFHGFDDASDYYAKCSSIKFVDDIKIPTLILNALNDPFLSKECYPFEKLATNPKITFEAPKNGGHVGFSYSGRNGYYWSELRALDFLLSSLELN